jgi:uncharacterized protein YggU (UPF0235/DUF167 family)
MPPSGPDDRPFRVVPGGVQLVVRVTPRAARSAVAGVVRDAEGRAVLHIRLAAPPVDGAANVALTAFFAQALGLRRGDISLAAGATARLKRLHLAGEGPVLAARLAAWLDAGRRG